jgi:hypothetical protein
MYSRKDLLRISTKGQSHRARSTAMGAAIEAGVGLGIGAASDSAQKCGGFGPCFENLGKEVFTPVGAIVGSVLGYGLSSNGWQVVYRAR